MEININNKVRININGCEDCPFCSFSPASTEEYTNEILYVCEIARMYTNMSEYSWNNYGFVPADFIWRNCPIK